MGIPIHSLLTSGKLGSINDLTGSCTVVESLQSCPASTPVKKNTWEWQISLFYSEIVTFSNYMESYKYLTQLLHHPHIWLRFLAHPLNSPGEWDRDGKLSHSLVLNQQLHSGQLDFWLILPYLILKPWNLNGILFRRMTYL